MNDMKAPLASPMLSRRGPRVERRLNDAVTAPVTSYIYGENSIRIFTDFTAIMTPLQDEIWRIEQMAFTARFASADVQALVHDSGTTVTNNDTIGRQSFAQSETAELTWIKGLVIPFGKTLSMNTFSGEGKMSFSVTRILRGT